jgi:predicted membrane protein
VESKPTVRPTPQLVLGILIIVLGVLFTLDNLGILHAADYLRLWPALLIIFGLTKLSQPGEAPSRFIGLIFATLGILLLLDNLNLVRFRIWDLWPLILVLLGIAMIWQVIRWGGGVAAERTSSISALAIMGGVQRNCASQDFRGGELTAIMGGCEIDLREATMQADEAVLHTFAFWGGIEIKVPENWTVTVEAFPFLGGFDERTHPPKEGPRKNLRVRGLAIMGGVEIRN